MITIWDSILIIEAKGYPLISYPDSVVKIDIKIEDTLLFEFGFAPRSQAQSWILNLPRKKSWLRYGRAHIQD